MPAGTIAVTIAKWISVLAGCTAAAYLLLHFYIYLAAEAVIERRYTLPSSLIHASEGADAIARAQHVMTIAGCFGCHGQDLKGRVLRGDPHLVETAGNLRALSKTYSDGDFERAIRRGLTPDARAMWGMPSFSYAYMRDKDVEDIIAYIRAQPQQGVPTPRPKFGWPARRAIVDGTLLPSSPDSPSIIMPADEGPRFDGGRYLANIGCAQCHGADLSGSGYAPDLNVGASYTRPQFFHLMRNGGSRRGFWLPTMGPLAKSRFYFLHDYEIDALYAYLVARKTIPPIPRPVTTTH
jgi:mono/diheme cytochrome c family protein